MNVALCTLRLGHLCCDLYGNVDKQNAELYIRYFMPHLNYYGYTVTLQHQLTRIGQTRLHAPQEYRLPHVAYAIIPHLLLGPLKCLEFEARLACLYRTVGAQLEHRAVRWQVVEHAPAW